MFGICCFIQRLEFVDGTKGLGDWVRNSEPGLFPTNVHIDAATAEDQFSSGQW